MATRALRTIVFAYRYLDGTEGSLFKYNLIHNNFTL